jgi:SnoaL-like protein
MAEFPLTDGRVLAILGGYFALLQRHFAAEDMMEAVLTEDFETGFVGGMVWKGLDGLRDFLSQRAGFFDERHEVQEILARDVLNDGEVEVKTRLQFVLRRWEDPAAASTEFTGTALHTWRLRRTDDGWRVAAQMVDGFEDLNESSTHLFATPDAGLNR